MRRLPRILTYLAAAFTMLALASCSGPSPNHVAAVNQANQHWLQMRSGLMLQMAQRQFDCGDLEQAEKALSEALKHDPKNGKLFTLAGRIALERGELERAHHLFSRAVELDPKLHDAHYYHGVVYQRWQQYDPALKHYEEAFTIAADQVAYLLAIGETLVAMDRADDALARLTDRLAYFDQNAGLRVAIAHVYALKHQPAKAVDFLKQAALLRPEDLQIAEELALAQLAARQAQPAILSFKRLLDQPALAQRRDLHLALAQAYLLGGQPADARAIYQQLVRRDPADAEVWVQLAQTSWAQGDAPAALAAAQRVMNLAPTRPEGPLIVGLVYQQRGQLDQALRQFGHAADLAPDSPAPLVFRGLALEQAGQPAAAAAAYTAALKRQPDDPRVRQLLTRVSDPK